MNLLSDLKLQSAKLDFDLVQLNELDTNGGMSIQLLFSANDGMDLRPIEKTASGGELSRLMLAIQATMSEKKSLPTLILDEIDTTTFTCETIENKQNEVEIGQYEEK